MEAFPFKTLASTSSQRRRSSSVGMSPRGFLFAACGRLSSWPWLRFRVVWPTGVALTTLSVADVAAGFADELGMPMSISLVWPQTGLACCLRCLGFSTSSELSESSIAVFVTLLGGAGFGESFFRWLRVRSSGDLLSSSIGIGDALDLPDDFGCVEVGCLAGVVFTVVETSQ